MKHSLLTALVALAALLAPWQLTAKSIDKTITTSGQLAQAVGGDTDATSLTVRGKIDVRDLDFIASKMASLQSLDLSGASIAAWTGERNLTAHTRYAADELPAMSLAGCPACTIILPQSLKAIGEGALAGAAMTSISIPASVTTLGDGAFAGATALKSVTVPATVTSCGTALFKACPVLAEVDFGPVTVPDQAFAECPALTKVTLAHMTTDIGAAAFSGCSRLSDFTISGKAWSLRTIGDHAFYATALTSLDLSNQGFLNSIGAWAFANCPRLSELILPEKVENFGEGALFHATGLTRMTPVQPRELGAAAFKGAKKLDLRAIGGNSAEVWGPYAFYGMTALTDVHLPDRLNYIGDHAFDGCTSLKLMNGPAIAQVPALGTDVWGSLDKSSIDLGVPKNMIDRFQAADQWKDFHFLEGADLPSELTTMSGTAQGAVSAAFDGTLLRLAVTAGNAAMERAEIFDIAGRTLLSREIGAATATIETSPWHGPVFIVRTVLADGTIAVIKLSR